MVPLMAVVMVASMVAPYGSALRRSPMLRHVAKACKTPSVGDGYYCVVATLALSAACGARGVNNGSMQQASTLLRSGLLRVHCGTT